MMIRRCFLVALLGCLCCARICLGLAEERVGPVPDAVAQAEFPAGITNLLRHESRVYSIWVNGNEHFHYQAGAKQVNELIQHFSKMQMRDHVLTIKAGRVQSTSFSGDSISYNVDLHVLGGIALAVHKQRGEPHTHEPTLTIHADPTKDADLLKELTLPDNIILKNEIASFPRMGKATQPMREVRYAHVQFDNDTPAADFAHGVSTHVTLWAMGQEDGIRLGKVDHKGYFHAPFSAQEMKNFEEGRRWITLTVGNWATAAQRDHPRLDANKLARDRTAAEPFKIGRPKYYYGRILFDDGSPPVISPPPWPGAGIHLTFSYTGMVTPDAEGYFKVFFTNEQFEQVKAKKVRRNIYVPRFEHEGRSTALHAFPGSKLSQNKDAAGVVKIPRPTAKGPND